MIRQKDAALMSAAQRMAEIGSLLALGYRRSRLSRSNCLDDHGQSKGACEPGAVDSLENPKEAIA